MIEIRQINPGEWQLQRQVRLAAVTDSPHAFADSPAATRQMPDSLWQQRTLSGAQGRESYCAIALDETDPIGMAVGLIDAGDASRTYLVSMWVAQRHRGTSVAPALLHKIVAWAISLDATILFAGVKPGNDRAATFYRKHGFETYHGVVPQHPATSDCEQVLLKELKAGG
jgi:GNAT superfamily N-acetyltransferase